MDRVRTRVGVFLFLLALVLLAAACPPSPPDPPAPTEEAAATEDASASGGLAPRSVPPPTGTGFMTVTSGKQNAAALAYPLPYANGGTGQTTFTNHQVVIAGSSALTGVTPGVAGLVLTSNGVGADPSFQAAGGGINFVQLWSPAGMAAANAGSWTAGNFTAGRAVGVTNQSVTITGVKFWANWTGGGTRTIKVRLCSTPSSTGSGAAALIASATASITPPTLATILFAAPQTVPPFISSGYLVSVYDTTGVNYPRQPCPSFLGSGACSTVSNMWPWRADNAGHEIWLGGNQFANGDACPTSNGAAGGALADEFYAVEPVIQ